MSYHENYYCSYRVIFIMKVIYYLLGVLKIAYVKILLQQC